MTGPELRVARLALGLSHTEFAASFGISERMSYAYERGFINGRRAHIPKPLALLVGLALTSEAVKTRLTTERELLALMRE